MGGAGRGAALCSWIAEDPVLSPQVPVGLISPYLKLSPPISPQVPVGLISSSWGGTQITVQGSNLPEGRTVLCRFDDLLTPAVPITSTSLNCTAPAHAPGLVRVEVSGDGLGMSSSTATFYYHDVVELGSLQPALVAGSGDAVIRVTGKNLLPGSACLLEGHEGASGYHVWISSSELLCKLTLPKAAGEYRIGVSVNMQQALLCDHSTG